jgi:hypothetical protein
MSCWYPRKAAASDAEDQPAVADLTVAASSARCSGWLAAAPAGGADFIRLVRAAVAVAVQRRGQHTRRGVQLGQPLPLRPIAFCRVHLLEQSGRLLLGLPDSLKLVEHTEHLVALPRAAGLKGRAPDRTGSHTPLAPGAQVVEEQIQAVRVWCADHRPVCGLMTRLRGTGDARTDGPGNTSSTAPDR